MTKKTCQAPAPGSATNPRGLMFFTSSFLNGVPNTGGGGSVIQTLRALQRPALRPNQRPMGGVWMSWLTGINGRGVLNFNYELPSLSLLKPADEPGSFSTTSAVVKLRASDPIPGQAAIRILHENFVNLDPANPNRIAWRGCAEIEALQLRMPTIWTLSVIAQGQLSGPIVKGCPPEVRIGTLFVECTLPYFVDNPIALP